jgi:hypothetical protein
VTTDEDTSVETPPLFRSVNLRIAELWSVEPWSSELLSLEPRSPHVGVLELMCECADETCTQILRMTDAEFAAVTSQAGVYAVLSGHERLMHDSEVVDRTDRYVLVHTHRTMKAAV